MTRRLLISLFLLICLLTAGWFLVDFIRQVGWENAWRFLIGESLLLILIGVGIWFLSPKRS